MPVKEVVDILFSPFFLEPPELLHFKIAVQEKDFQQFVPPPPVSCKAGAGQPKGPRKQPAGSLAPDLHLSALVESSSLR